MSTHHLFSLGLSFLIHKMGQGDIWKRRILASHQPQSVRFYMNLDAICPRTFTSCLTAPWVAISKLLIWWLSQNTRLQGPQRNPWPISFWMQMLCSWIACHLEQTDDKWARFSFVLENFYMAFFFLQNYKVNTLAFLWCEACIFLG